jgi:hypothetical protein
MQDKLKILAFLSSGVAALVKGDALSVLHFGDFTPPLAA